VGATQTPCQGSKCAKIGTTQSGKHMGIWGGRGRWGRKWEGLGTTVAVKVAEVQNMARHILRLAGQHLIGRATRAGDEVNREAEMANPTKCRDSLIVFLTRYL
jgi:hypothetical protein